MCESSINFQRIADSTENPKVKKVFTTLATRQVEFCSSFETLPLQATLVMGGTKSFRNIFTRWLAGQNSNFESEQDMSRPGEYVIIDRDEEADQNSPLPVLASTMEANAFYDFPAFLGAKDVAYAVTATHFMKKLIENVSSLKMCFLIEHYKMTNTLAYRDELKNFLKQVAELIRNVDYVEDNVVFVASNVPVTFSNTSDEQIIDAIVQRMHQVKQELQQENGQNEMENSKIIKFIDLMIIPDEEGSYPRLALFRSPNEQGPVSNIALLQEIRLHIEQKLQNLRFVEMAVEDFRLVVPETLFHDVTTIMGEIRESISDDIKNSFHKMQEYFVTEEAAINEETIESDLIRVHERMKFGYEKMLATNASAFASANLEQCVNRTIVGGTDVTGDSFKLDFTSTLDSVDAWEFLGTIAGGGHADIKWCVNGLTDVIRYLGDSQKWYNFANSLYARLLNCEISTNTGTYDNSLEDITIDREVLEKNSKAFLREITQEQLFVQYNSIDDVALSEFKLESVRKIVNLPTKCRPENLLRFSTQGYLNDFHSLENEFFGSSNRASYVPHYRSLYARVEKYAENRTTSDKAPHSKDYALLHYLRMAILSRIQSMKNTVDHNVFTDVGDYFSTYQERMNMFKGAFNTLLLDTYQQQSQTTVNSLIIEAFAKLESTTHDIDEIDEAIGHEIAQLIAKVENQTEQSMTHREKLASQLPLKVLLGILKLICVASSFWGPIGAVASAAEAYLLVRNVDGYLNADTEAEHPMIEGAQKFADDTKNMYRLEGKSLGENLSKLNIDKIDDPPEVMQLIAKDQGFQRLKNKVHQLIHALNDRSFDETAYLREKKRIKQELNWYIEQLSQKQADDDNETKEKKRSALIKWTERVKTMITAAESGVKEYELSVNLASKVGDRMKQVDGTITKLKEYEHSARARLMPEIDIIQTDMAHVLRDSAYKSHAVFAKNKGMLKNLMRNFKRDIGSVIRTLTSGSSVEQNITACIEEIYSGIRTSVQIYDRIQNYKDQSLLAEYIIIDPGLKIVPKDNSSFSREIEQLELKIRANLVLQECERILGTFKQFVFPFAHSFPDWFDITFYLRPRNANSLITKAIRQVNQLKNSLNLFRTTIVKLPDTVFPNVKFGTSNIDRKPFFIWRHETHGKKISKILQTREVILIADVRQMRNAENGDLNAVKFSEIGIRFLSPNKTIEDGLFTVMSNFLVEMTHMGESHYRCDDEYYTFHQTMISMTHSVNALNNVQSDAVYVKADTITTTVKNNPLIFSPYAAWKIKLKDDSPNAVQKEQSHKALQTYVNQHIDLALEGRGGYVQFPARSCENALTFSQQHSHDYHRHDLNAPFATNSASRIQSPITSVIYWLSGTVGYIKPFSTLTKIHNDHIRGSFRAIFSPGSIKNDANAAAISAKFNVIESLTLADFLVRWLTKVKLYDSNVDESTNLIEIRAFALNLAERVENLVKLHVPDKTAQLDTLALISRLEKELMINQNSTAIGNVLYQTVVDANPDLDWARFNDHIRQAMAELGLD